MAKTANPAKTRQRAKSGLLTRVLILILLWASAPSSTPCGVRWSAPRRIRKRLAAQVDAQRQANESLAADIAEGTTPEKMEELAREELGLVTPGEYVFYDVSN